MERRPNATTLSKMENGGGTSCESKLREIVFLAHLEQCSLENSEYHNLFVNGSSSYVESTSEY